MGLMNHDYTYSTKARRPPPAPTAEELEEKHKKEISKKDKEIKRLKEEIAEMILLGDVCSTPKKR